MATVNFSVPDEVKKAFDRAFKSTSKSAVIADLMQRAVADLEHKQQRTELFRLLTKRRRARPNVRSEYSLGAYIGAYVTLVVDASVVV